MMDSKDTSSVTEDQAPIPETVVDLQAPLQELAPIGLPMDNQTPTPEASTSSQTFQNSAHTTSHTAGQAPTPATDTSSQDSPPRDPWLRKNVLSFDGGGVRGYYSLLFLQRLMEFVREEEQNRDLIAGEEPTSSFSPFNEPDNVSHLPSLNEGYVPFLPCHYFDYIAGTSTGALIAIMLGRFRMTVDDCIHEYKDLAGNVFGHPRHFHYMNSLIPRHKYDTKKFESIIKDVIRRREEQGRQDPVDARFEIENGLCRVFVVANTVESGGTVSENRFFRSYQINTRQSSQLNRASFPEKLRTRHSGRPSDNHVWSVARATTAAPMYFEPFEMRMDGWAARPTNTQTQNGSVRRSGTMTDNHSYVEKLEDGGFGHANNPSKEMLDEIRNQPNIDVGTFVSIGTARPREQRTRSRLLRAIRRGIARLGDPEPTHDQMGRVAQKEGFPYYRFNKPDGLPGIEMDDWRPKATGNDTLQEIETAFERCAGRPETVQQLQECARRLVNARRARYNASPHKWHRFSLGTYFYCDGKCTDGPQREIDEVKFRAHLIEAHGIVGDDRLEREVNDCREQWTYRGRR